MGWGLGMIDRAIVVTCAGKGGDGAVSFKREKYIPRGGPDGGNGGLGGSVVIQASKEVTTLSFFRNGKNYTAKNGIPGGRKNMHGKKGDDLILIVPIGTIVKEKKQNGEMELTGDLDKDNSIITIAYGGMGGRGNKEFVSSTNQAPLLREQGEEGEKTEIELELRTLADVGIVGKPNAGKSTLLQQLTNAKPIIGDYPFTTKQPVLGVMEEPTRATLIAEIQGLIQGAHIGVGLGHKFLQHAERTGIFIHLIDGTNPAVFDDYKVVEEELRLYNEALSKKQKVVVINKSDICDSSAAISQLRSNPDLKDVKLISVSAKTGEGIRELEVAVWELLEEYKRNIYENEKAPLKISRERAEGKHEDVEWDQNQRLATIYFSPATRLVALLNMDDFRILPQLINELRKNGTMNVMLSAGVQPGNVIRIGDWEFDWEYEI